MSYESKILTKDETIAFIQNMRWFAGLGTVRATKLQSGTFRVRASKAAWSYWVEVD